MFVWIDLVALGEDERDEDALMLGMYGAPPMAGTIVWFAE
jgi:hypothetical protein